MRDFTVHHDGVTLAVSRGGRGRPLVLCPGLLSTQADQRELVDLLRADHDVITFDLRGHGRSSTADRYDFAAFLSDLTAVMAEVGRLDLPSPPVLAGYSLGADLAVYYASEHPDTVSGLVLVDGANPLPEPFITDADAAQFQAMREDPEMWEEFERAKGTAHQMLLGVADLIALDREIDVVRAAILERFRELDLPITMIMSLAIAGDSDEGRVPRHNANWRAGIERLVRAKPEIAASWLDGPHPLVFTHAREIAEAIRKFQRAPEFG
ncbi:alpha/beta fold hydrolase [Nocardia sp. NPDC050406]|uniref:alpha/beta fold hydrolase n=1 Tax=Nocardia sp. NPDC050406 TaxID=3364318 RepID=UPI00378B2CFA